MRGASGVRNLTLGVLVPVAALAVAGAGGGAVWAWWADPPARSEATRGNVELLLGEQFAVDGRYAVTGVLLGLVAGCALAWALRSTGWLLVVGVSVGGAAAAGLSYWLGLMWGPAPGAGGDRGALLSGGLAVHVPGVFLSWPVGAVLGVLVVVWLLDRAEDRTGESTLSSLTHAQ